MTAKIKLNAASGGGSVSIQAPSSSSNNRVYTLPDTAHISTLGGISEFDQWYLTSDVNNSGNDAVITAWSRFAESDEAAASPLGTGMSHSSGVFTFPSTGKYLVVFNGVYFLGADDNVLVFTQVTKNNSAYNTYGTSKDGNPGSHYVSGSGVSFAFIDVTDTSNVKVRFYATSIGTNSQVQGFDSTNGVQSTALFVRIGDT
tara:strand:+ start:1100 stop:1702 length:603 start_codon:yes stop_codon:yes gene_type:complete